MKLNSFIKSVREHGRERTRQTTGYDYLRNRGHHQQKGNRPGGRHNPPRGRGRLLARQRHSARATETSATGKSIFAHDPNGKVAAAYESLRGHDF